MESVQAACDPAISRFHCVTYPESHSLRFAAC
jgi:hypothetical protein